MSLLLINLQSNQQIKLSDDSSLIIGRSSVTGCTDKRVSRNHGKLTATLDGKLHLVALHHNPCFFTRNGVPPVKQLNKNEEETLSEGDCIGLLPDAFWFRISKDLGKEIKIENDDSILPNSETSIENRETEVKTEDSDSNGLNSETSNKKNNIPNVSPNKLSLDSGTEAHAEEENSLSENHVKESAVSSSDVSEKLLDSSGEKSPLKSPEFEKTRRLPLWMYQIDDSKTSKRTLPENDGKNNKKTKGFKAKKQKNKKNSSSKECTNNLKNSDCPSTSKAITVESPQGISTINSDESENEGSQTLKKEFTEYEKKNDVQNNCSTEPQKRKICIYEDTCYRQQHLHREKFSHPGDQDFVPYEERPLCQYGENCYRNSKYHKVEFRHPPAGPNSHANHPSSSSSCTSLGEERPPCLSGSRCQNLKPKHRKDFYHPPKGYNCYFHYSEEDIFFDGDSYDSDSDSYIDYFVWSDPCDDFDYDFFDTYSFDYFF